MLHSVELEEEASQMPSLETGPAMRMPTMSMPLVSHYVVSVPSSSSLLRGLNKYLSRLGTDGMSRINISVVPTADGYDLLILKMTAMQTHTKDMATAESTLKKLERFLRSRLLQS